MYSSLSAPIEGGLDTPFGASSPARRPPELLMANVVGSGRGDKIAKWAADAGIKSSDIEPGGRYASLMTKMLAEMQSGTAKESIAEACEAIKKYD